MLKGKKWNLVKLIRVKLEEKMISYKFNRYLE